MAKRKRLTPATLPQDLETKASPPANTPPIAQMAGAASALNAARALEDEMSTARAQGRLIVTLPLEAIAESHLMRDRLGVDAPEMDALMASLMAHGQRTAIEIEALEGERYGLISGWRRLTALKALYAKTGEERFSRVAAILRTPADRADAYIAMVEENEIRAGLSYYERARVAARAAGQGAFDSAEAAVDALFAAGSRARRSKIRSFLRIHAALDDVLRFPTALPERLGLKLAEALKAGRGAELRAAVETSDCETAEAEAACLNRILAQGSQNQSARSSDKTGSKKATLFQEQGLKLVANMAEGHVSYSLSGSRIDANLQETLSDLLIGHLKSL